MSSKKEDSYCHAQQWPSKTSSVPRAPDAVSDHFASSHTCSFNLEWHECSTQCLQFVSFFIFGPSVISTHLILFRFLLYDAQADSRQFQTCIGLRIITVNIRLYGYPYRTIWDVLFLLDFYKGEAKFIDN